MSQLSIDQLPDLCLRKIFGFLKLRDLARCRSVSHLFNYYANKIPARELVVHSWNGYNPSRWYLSERPIESGSEISQRAFDSLQTSQLQLLKQLKFLYVYSFRSADLEFLNSCERLEHFEIGRCSLRDTLIEWTFPNLRVLSMGVSDHLQLILKTPKLEVLRCRYLERIEFEHPETVKILECDECYDADTIVMAKLKNLEVFRFNVGYDALDHVPPAIWQHLKELNLRLDWTMLGIGTYRALCRSLTDLLSRPKNSEELKIYLNDVRLVRASQLEDFDFMRNQTFKFHLKNYKLLTAGRRFDDETYINYNYLVNNVEELSSDFFEKFPSIQTVEVTGPFDHDQLTWFLENTSDLRELILSSASVPDFLNNFLNNNLPNITDRLTELKVTEPLPVEQALDLAAKLFQRIASFDKFESKAPWNETIAIRRDPSAKDRFELWFHAIKNEAATVTSHRTKRKWTNLVELCEKRKANFDPPARSSKRIKREN